MAVYNQLAWLSSHAVYVVLVDNLEGSVIRCKAKNSDVTIHSN